MIDSPARSADVSRASTRSDAAVVDVGPAFADCPPGVALALGQADFAEGVDQRHAVPSSVGARRLLARHVGEDLGELAIGCLVDLGAEEDFRCLQRRGQGLVAVNQPRQVGGKLLLRGTLARLGRVLALQLFDLGPERDR